MSEQSGPQLPDPWFRSLVERSPEMVFRFRCIDPVGFEYVSPAALTLTGAPPESFLEDPETYRRMLDSGPSIVERFLAAGSARHLQTERLRRPDGTTVWVEIEGVVVRDAAGTAIAVEGGVRDVTARVVAQREAMLEARILASIRDAVIATDVAGTVTFWNAGAERFFGRRAEDMLGGPLGAGVDFSALDGTGGIEAALRDGLAWEGEIRIRDEGDVERILGVNLWPQADDAASVSRVYIAWDVTAARRSVEAAARLATLVEQADDAIYAIGPDGVVLTWNSGAERLTGIPALDAIGHQSPLVEPPFDERSDLRRRVFGGEIQRLEGAQMRRADGSLIPVSILAGPVRGPSGEVEALSVIARDARVRRDAEQALRFRTAILDAMEDAVIVTEPDRSIVLWSPGAVQLFGIPEAEALGHTLAEVAPHRVLGTTTDAAIHEIETGRTFRGDLEYTRPDGTLMVGEITASSFVGSEGRHLRIAVIRDVTETRRATEAAGRLAAIVETVGDLIATTDLEGRITSWNSGGEALLALRSTEMMGRTLAAFLAPESMPVAWGMRGRVVDGAERVAHGELMAVAKDGARVPLLSSLAAVRGADGVATGISLIARDIRRRKSLEEQLRQAHKLEAVGRLSGGLAHDFNELMTAVTGYAHLIEAAVPAGGSVAEDARQILRATGRASELTQSMLAFSRGRPLEPRVVSLDDLVDEMLPMLRRLIPERVELHTSIASDAALTADPAELELILVNLVINAAEAMPAGGLLGIDTSLVDIGQAFADGHLGIVPGRFAQVEVSDTGVGMTPEVRDHIFEPYFTTKPAGAATGMGLANVRASVDRAGGTVWVVSEPGNGTTFRLLFPAVDAPASAPAAAPDPMPRGGSERILLVEDDPLVRALSTAVLRRAGYRLTVRSDPREAVDLDPRDHDLMVLDMVMPGLGGTALAARLRERRDDLPIVFMTGFTERSIADEIDPLTQEPLLQKPFTPAQLLAAVRTALDRG
jgi:two-component system cell cycle sensor histidine kinase/response regulator CckA